MKRKLVNFFSLVFSSSSVLLVTGGTCPFCGLPAACPAGITTLLGTGFLATGLVYGFMALKQKIAGLLPSLLNKEGRAGVRR